MSKLCFIPDWLNQTLNETGTSLDEFVTKIDSTIVSRHDVINYHKSQLEFLKLLTKGNFCKDDTYSMYQNLFVHSLPDIPEIELIVRNCNIEEIIWDNMVTAAAIQQNVSFRFEASADGTVIYIIGECAFDVQSSDLGTAEPKSLICSILEKMHGCLRVQNGSIDKSSAFRESPLLTQLYVNEKFC